MTARAEGAGSLEGPAANVEANGEAARETAKRSTSRPATIMCRTLHGKRRLRNSRMLALVLFIGSANCASLTKASKSPKASNWLKHRGDQRDGIRNQDERTP